MTTKVERCKLAEDLSISRVVTGLWQIADMERGDQELNLTKVVEAMIPYVDVGLTSFDMADHYGSAEDIAGLFVAGRNLQTSCQMLTKWVPPLGRVTRDDVRAAVERSLERLQSEQLELLQFHAWSYGDPSWLDCLFWLQELKDEGLIGQLGLTNFDTAHLRVALSSGIEIVSNQVCFSLLDRRPQRGLSQLCVERGVKLLAYGTLAGGLLTERWLGKTEPGPDELSTWSQMKYRRFIETAGGWEVYQQLLQTMADIAAKHGVSVANVASRYVLEAAAVGAVIIGARLGEREHIQDTLRLFEFSLDDADHKALEATLVALRAIPGDSGDEYRKPPFLTASGDLSHHLESFPAPYDVQSLAGDRRVVLSGTPWEGLAGFGRAVRFGERILISGTTATHGDKLIGGQDAAAQLHFVIDKLNGVLQSLGSCLDEVVRTRIYVRNIADWQEVARAHGERFKDILPANTLIEANLVGAEYLVEVEAEAVVGSS